MPFTQNKFVGRRKHVTRRLTIDGTLAGESDMTASDHSGSGNTAYFHTTPQPSEAHFHVTLLSGIIESARINADDYADIAGGLPVGLQVYHKDKDGNILEDLTQAPIQKTAEWGYYASDADLKQWGAGNEFVTIHWTFAIAADTIQLNPNETFGIEVNDDLTSLVEHRFLVHGFIE